MPPRERAGSSCGIVGLRLLLVVAPVVGRPAEDVLGARRRLGAVLGEHLVGEVVVLEVVGRDRSHRDRELELAPVHRFEGRVVLAPLPGLGEQGHRVLPVIALLYPPAAVVEPDHRDVEQCRVEPGRLGDRVAEVDRPLAERDDLDRRVVGDRLGDDVDGVRVVEDPRVRAELLHLGADVLQHRDRAKRHEEPAGTLRLLTDDAVLEGDALVVDARREAAGTERREDSVAAVERRATVGRGGDRDVEAAGACHLLRERPDQLQPVGIEVDEHDLGAVEVAPVRHERRHRAGAPRRASPQVHELYPRHRSRHSLIAPPSIPRTKCRCRKRYTTTIGSATSTAAAATLVGRRRARRPRRS